MSQTADGSIRSTEEVEAAIALRKKIKENGLKRAIELMDPTERSYARRTIVHALEAFVAPQVAGTIITEITVFTARGEKYVIYADKAAEGLATLFSDHDNEKSFGRELATQWFADELAKLRSTAVKHEMYNGEIV